MYPSIRGPAYSGAVMTATETLAVNVLTVMYCFVTENWDGFVPRGRFSKFMCSVQVSLVLSVDGQWAAVHVMRAECSDCVCSVACLCEVEFCFAVAGVHCFYTFVSTQENVQRCSFLPSVCPGMILCHLLLIFLTIHFQHYHMLCMCVCNVCRCMYIHMCDMTDRHPFNGLFSTTS